MNDNNRIPKISIHKTTSDVNMDTNIKKIPIKNNLTHTKEDDIMAMAQLLRTPAIIIDKDKTKDFFLKLNSNKPTQAFWDDCKNIRESVSVEDINFMNDLIKKRLNNGK